MDPRPPVANALIEASAEILPSTNAMPLTVQYTRRTMRMVTLSAMELDSVASLSNSTNLAFFGTSVGALIAFAIVLATVDIPDAKSYAMFVALTAVSIVTTLYFAVKAVTDYVTARRRLTEIKQGLS